jgi:hypothetical protein
MMENLGQGKITREEAASYLKENSRSLDRSQSRGDASEPQGMTDD